MSWLFGKKEKNKTKTKIKPPRPISQEEILSSLKASDKYGAVTIGHCGCMASSQLIGQYFSFTHVPSLPLAECTAGKCSCEYQGVLERRQGKDKRVTMRRESLRMEDDRRKVCRRKEDKTWNSNNF